MGDTLEIFGNEYENVAGFKVKDSNGNVLIYTRGGGGGYVTQDANGNIILPDEGDGDGGGSSAQIKTGTFTGNDGNVIQIPCSFAPDLIYIRGDLTGSTSLRGICSVTIVKDVEMIVTADSSTSASEEYLLVGMHGITGYNTNTSYPYATYANGILSIDTVQNSGTARWNSTITYSYKLVKWGDGSTSGIPLNTQLVDFTACTKDYAINTQGELTPQEWYYATDFVPVASDMTFSYTAGTWTYIVFYNSSQSFISYISVQTDGTVDSSDSNTSHGTLSGSKIPSTAAYVRMSGTYPDDSKISLIRTA